MQLKKYRHEDKMIMWSYRGNGKAVLFPTVFKQGGEEMQKKKKKKFGRLLAICHQNSWTIYVFSQ